MAVLEIEKVATETHCVACEDELVSGECLNIDCPEAQRAATKDARRSTAKATARAASPVANAPRAWTRSGNVD